MLTSFQKDVRDVAALLALTAILFGFQLGKAGLLDPDEPFYALTAKEMVQHSDPWTPRLFGEPQFEKPILFYWVLYASFKFFGIHEASARLGPALAGALTVLLVYLWGRLLFGRRSAALLAALILATAAQFIVLSRVVLTDVFLCLFITGAWTAFTWGWKNERFRAMSGHLFFVSCALGFLTKGPLGFLIPLAGIASFAFFSGQRHLFSKLPWMSGLPLFAAIGLPWYALMAKLHGAGFWGHFFVHENIRRFFVAEHTGMDRWFFYPLVFLLGFLPWSGAALWSFWQSLRSRDFLSYCLWVPLAFFMLAKSKLMSYIFPLYPVAALLCAQHLMRVADGWARGQRTPRILVAVQGIFLVAAPCVVTVAASVFAERSGLQLAAPILGIAALWVPCSWASFYFLFRRDLTRSVASGVLGIVWFSCLAFGWLLPQATPAFSTRDWAESVTRAAAASPGTPIFASKMYVRGLSYYGGRRDVAVFSSHPRGDFYTLHSIPIVSDVASFLRDYADRFPAFLFLRPKEYKHLTNHLTEGYRAVILEKGPQRLLVRLDRA